MNLLKVVCACLVVVSASTAQSDFSGRIRNTFTKEGVQNPNIVVNASHRVGKSGLSLVAFCNIYKGWAETYIGPKYVFSNWLFASAHVGMETNENWWRVAGSVGLSYKPLSWFNLYEYGASGDKKDYWFSSFVLAVNENLKAEAKSYKIGPVYKVGAGGILNIFKTPLAISLTPLHNFSSKRTECEITIYFKF